MLKRLLPLCAAAAVLQAASGATLGRRLAELPLCDEACVAKNIELSKQAAEGCTGAKCPDARRRLRAVEEGGPTEEECEAFVEAHATSANFNNATFRAVVDPEVLNGTVVDGVIVPLPEMAAAEMLDEVDDAMAPGTSTLGETPSKFYSPEASKLFGKVQEYMVVGGQAFDISSLDGAMIKVNNTWIPQPLPSGKFFVCVDDPEHGTAFGDVDDQWDHSKPSGIKVHLNGTCEVMEFAGGFDGYFSTDAGDGHEDGFAQAVKEMIMDKHALVGECVKKDHPWNKHVNLFLWTLLDMAAPVNYDYPEDQVVADGGGRMANIMKVRKACEEIIEVGFCKYE